MNRNKTTCVLFYLFYTIYFFSDQIIQIGVNIRLYVKIFFLTKSYALDILLRMKLSLIYKVTELNYYSKCDSNIQKLI